MSQEDVKIYKWNGIYGFLPYMPRIANLRQLPKDDALKKSTEWVFAFKRRGTHSKEVKKMVDSLAEKLQCDKIVAVPPSSVEAQPNSLQKIYGSHMSRIDDVESRKWKHDKKIPDDYIKSFMVTGVNKNEKILIVDDVCTTGKTLKHYNNFFKENGFITAIACIAFHYELDFKEVKNINPLIKQEIKNIQDNAEPQNFKNVAEAAAYLRDKGWNLSQSNMYNHRKKGLIKPDFGKRGFTLKNLLRYASNHLSLADTLQKIDDENLGRDKTKAEIERIKEQTKRERIKRLKESGDLIEKDVVYLQFAVLTAGLENAIKGQFQTDAGEAVELIKESDDPERQFVEIGNDIVDRALNEMAKITNIEVVFGDN